MQQTDPQGAYAYRSAVSAVVITAAMLLLALMLRVDGMQSELDELRGQLRDMRMDLAELDALDELPSACVPVVLPPVRSGSAL